MRVRMVHAELPLAAICKQNGLVMLCMDFCWLQPPKPLATATCNQVLSSSQLVPILTFWEPEERQPAAHSQLFSQTMLASTKP